MGRHCHTCVHPERAAIERDLVMRTATKQALADRYGLTWRSIHEHQRKHLGPAVIEAARGIQVAQARTLVQRIEDMCAEAERVLAEGVKIRHGRTILAAINQLRPSLELLGKATGELRDRVEVVHRVELPDQKLVAEKAERLLKEMGATVLWPHQSTEGLDANSLAQKVVGPPAGV